MKNRKLNSKNPKYNNTNKEKEKIIIKKTPLIGKAKGYGVFYADEK